MINWLKAAKKESFKSDYKYKVGAILVSGGRIISRGHNQVRLKSIGCRRYSKWMESLHAERDCLSRINKDMIRGAVLYIFRQNGKGRPALARPCPQCRWMIEDLGVRKVIYSINDHPYYEIGKSNEKIF